MFETVKSTERIFSTGICDSSHWKGDLPLSTPTTPDMQFIFARLTFDNLAAPSTWEFHANGM